MTKRLLGWLLPALLFPGLSRAMCAMSDLRAFPATATLAPTSILILEGYEASQPVIRALNKKYPVYLVSASGRVRLLVQALHEGQFRLTQAVVKPERPLKPGQTYTLLIEGVEPYQAPVRYNSRLRRSEPYQYTVLAPTRPPATVSWLTYPHESKKTLVQYGCGPATNVFFDFALSVPTADTAFVVRAEVRSQATGRTTTFYLESEKGRVGIGHGMCSGGFTFDQGTDYLVSFTLIDGVGRPLLATREALAFTKPTVETDPRDR
ncbi:hypothetical protein GCM10027578_03130 [Spirosoma luteolum]